MEDNGYVKLGDMMRSLNQQTICFYQMMNPTFATNDPDLIKVKTHKLIGRLRNTNCDFFKPKYQCLIKKC